MFTIMICALVMSTTLAKEKTVEELLDHICTTMVNEIAKSMGSKDIMTIEKALKHAAALVKPELREVAEKTGQTTKQVARTINMRVAQDNRLFDLLAKQVQRGISARSANVAFSKYIAGLVYSALTQP